MVVLSNYFWVHRLALPPLALLIKLAVAMPLAAQTLPPLHPATDSLAKPSEKTQPAILSQSNPAAPPLPLHRQPVPRQPFQPQILPLVPQGDTETQSTADQRITPNIAIITPSAYGASQGDLAVGVGVQARSRFSDRGDGVIGAKIGFGDSRESVGLEVGLVLVDLDNPWQDGAFNFKLHRHLNPDLVVAAGMQSIARFGDTDSEASLYGVATQRFALRPQVTDPLSQLYVSVGVGNGQFRSEADVLANESSVGLFGSVALRLTAGASAIAEWTGQDLTVGMAIVPFPDQPFVIVPALSDLTGSAGDGVRFLFSASYSFSF
jgi:hypothetical protein